MATSDQDEINESDLTVIDGQAIDTLARKNIFNAVISERLEKSLEFNTEQLETIAKYIRTQVFSLLAAAIYILLAVINTSAVDFIGKASEFKLPIIQVNVDITAFYVIASALLFILFLYNNFSLQHLWEKVAKLPSVYPDGSIVPNKLSSWVLNTIIFRNFSYGQKDYSTLINVKYFVCSVLHWYLIPMILLVIWFQYLPKQEVIGSIAIMTVFIFTLLIARYFKLLAQVTLSGKTLAISHFFQHPKNYLSALSAIPMLLFMQAVHHVSIDNTDNMSDAPSSYFGRLLEGDLSSQDFSDRKWFNIDLQNRLLDEAKFQNAVINNMQFNNSHLIDALFTSSEITNAKFNDTNSSGIDFNFSQFIDVDFSNAKVIDARFIYAKFLASNKFYYTDLSLSNFTDADLRGAVFDIHMDQFSGTDKTTDLYSAIFDRANLTGVDFKNVSAKEASFVSAIANESSWYSATLEQANFSKAQLKDANFEWAWIEGADFSDADIRGTNFANATFDESTKFTGARYNAETKWPEKFDVESSGAILNNEEVKQSKSLRD